MSAAKVQIPSRFEALQHMTTREEELSSIIRPVQKAIAAIDEIYDDMTSAGQGAFLVLHGLSGSGKSTYLHTLRLFREGVRTLSIDAEQPIPEALDDLVEGPERLRAVVLAGREAVANTSEAELEVALHAINQFIRSREGRKALVVWPCNSDDAARRILQKAKQIGGDALLGVFPDGFRFEGPPKAEYVEIAQGTVQALNEGATLITLGITTERAEELAVEAPTIGAFLKSLREEERRNRSALINLLPETERHNLWVVAIAGNDPETEVGTLTTGSHFSADIDRLLASTDANVVQDLKRYPAKLGLLGRSFDARILQIPCMTVIAVVRDLADPMLKQRLEAQGFSMKPPGDGIERLRESQLARALLNEPVTPRTAGRRPGRERQEELMKLTQFAKTDDGALNRLLGEALIKAGLIDSYKAEDGIGAAQKRSTDILCTTRDASVRLEFMWRAQTTVGEIAKYVLEKLYHYGRAIGFLNGH
jgi:DNA (cytosine-5)-methyltransferase 1